MMRGSNTLDIGATTFGIMAHSITISKCDTKHVFSIIKLNAYAECRYAECHLS
jgi:hypothetical protein